MVRVMEIARDALTLKIKYSFIFGRFLSTLANSLRSFIIYFQFTLNPHK